MSQEMKLAPRLIQMMEVLQLPTLALQERIDVELVSNPVLEVEEPGHDEPAEVDTGADEEWGERDLVVGDDSRAADEFSRLDQMTGEYGSDFANPDAPMSHADHGEPDAKLEAMANTPAHTMSLDAHLIQQWSFLGLSPEVDLAGRRVIEHIDGEGYLRTPLDELARATDTQAAMEVDTLTDALWAVQKLDPTGVGARDLRECLMLQLAAKADAGQAAEMALPLRIVAEFLREVQGNQLPTVVKRTGCSMDQVRSAMTLIAHLDPVPGRQIGGDSVPMITPDVIVTLDRHSRPIIRLTDSNLPALAINAEYNRQARSRNTDKDTKNFLKRNIRSAQWLIEAIVQRRHTIRRVSEEIFAVQNEFLLHGKEALKPLPMSDVAEKVGVHIATVSRAVSDKYADTPQGIVPLRMFFSGGTTTASGEEVSWDAVKLKLKEIIDAEDKSKPLSDEKLMAELAKNGIDIKRRTIAKYRDQLEIPSARKRKQY
jgi:RNA polymerase sigma-54 factor